MGSQPPPDRITVRIDEGNIVPIEQDFARSPALMDELRAACKPYEDTRRAMRALRSIE